MTKILVIDDKKDNLISVEASIRQLEPEYEVLTAEDGIQGIKLAQTEHPDTILLDVYMPKMDGYEVCRRLRADKSTHRIPVIFLTALKTGAGDRIKGLELGGDAYLSKPIDSVELLANLHAMLRIKKVEDELEQKKNSLEIKVDERTQSLQISEKKYRELVQLAPDGIVTVDKKGIITSINEALLKLSGYEKEELVGKPLTAVAVIHTQDTRHYVKKFTAIINGARPEPFEVRWACKDGSTVDSEIHVTVTRNGRKISGLLAIVRDIRERKRAEEQLKKSEEKYRTLAEAAQDAIFIIDHENNISFVNSYGAGLFGLTPSEVIGKPHHKMFAPDVFKQQNQSLRQVFQSGETLQQERRAVFGKHAVWLSTYLVPLINNAGKIYAVLGISRDVTARKQAEEALASQFKQLKSLHEFVEKLNRATTLQAAYSAAIQGMMTILKADRASILLVDPDDVVRFKFWQGLSAPYRKAVEGHFPWELSDLKAQPIFISSIADASLPEKLTETVLKEGIHACTFVPLIGKNRLLGKFMTYYNQVHVFEPDETNIARVFADNLATVIERFQNLETLKESEERFHSLAKTANDAIIISNIRGTIQFFNQAAERIFGYSAAEAFDSKVDLLIPDKYKTRYQSGIRRYLKTGETTIFEKTLELTGKRRDGSLFPIELSLSQVRRAEEVIIIGIIRDITERKQAEKVLQKSEEKYRTLVENSPTGILSIDTRGNITQANQKLLEILGSPSAEATMEINIFEFKPLQAVGATEAFRQVLKTGKFIHMEHEYTSKWGKKSFIRYKVVPIRDERKTIIGAQANIEDITEEKKAREEISFLANALKSINECVSVTDEKDKLIFVNEAFIKTYGYTETELIGNVIREIVGSPKNPPNIVKEILPATFRGGWRGEIINRKKDGSEFPVALSTSPVRDETGKIIALIGVAEDITERKQAEERMQIVARFSARATGEDFFSALVQSMAQALKVKIVFAAELILTEPTRARALAIWIGERLVENFDWLLPGTPCAEVVQGKTKCFIKDLRATFPDDEWLAEVGAESYLGIPLTDSRGQVIGHIGVMDDKPFDEPRQIENLMEIFADRVGAELERQRAAEILKASESKYRALFEGIDDAAFVHPFTEEGFFNFIEVNEVACRRLGYSREELLNLSAADISAPEDVLLRGGRQGRKELLKDQRMVFEAVHLTKSGQRIPVEISATSFELDGQTVIMSLARDITERKQAENERQRARAFLQTVIDNIPGAVLVINRDYSIALANQTVRKLSKKEITVGCCYCYEISHRRNNPCENFEHPCPLPEVIATRKLVTVEHIHYDAEGHELIVEIGAAPIFDEQGEIVQIVEVHHDITEKRGLEAQLRQAQKMESVGRLAGGIAHDFNNMLSIINGYSELLLMEMSPDDPPRTRTKIQNIFEAGQRAAALTRQLLAYSRKQLLEMKVVNLNTVVQGAEKLLRQTIGENIELIFKPGKNLASVKIDPGQFEQVIMNLAINARDAMPRGGKLILETHNITLDEAYAARRVNVEAGDYIQLTLSDTGVGMNRETMDQIFEPFFTTKEFGVGTGLGLSTVFGIIKQSGGHITVYSEKGVGTTFKLYLPRVTATPETNRKVAKPALATGTETILLAEDEAGVRTMAQSSLEAAGYRVLAADSGPAALEILKAEKQPVDLLFTDVVMPGMSGKELAEKAYALWPNLRVLYMSGYTDDIIANQGILEVGTHFIQKPFSPVDLTRKVREIFDEPV